MLCVRCLRNAHEGPCFMLNGYEPSEHTLRGAIAFLRGAFHNDGAEGESVHLQRARAAPRCIQAVMSDPRPRLKLVYPDGHQVLVSCERCRNFLPVCGVTDYFSDDGRCLRGNGALAGKGFGCAHFDLHRKRAAVRDAAEP